MTDNENRTADISFFKPNINVLKELFRLFQRLWLLLYHSIWRRVIVQGHNHLLGGLHQFSMSLTLSPYRALTYLFIFWILGMVMVAKLKVDGDLVLSDPNSAPYVQVEGKNDSGIFSDISNMLEGLLKRDDKADKSKEIFTSPVTEIKTVCSTEKVEGQDKCKDITTNTTKAISNHSCEKIINIPTYALDLLLPVFNLKESSKCELVDNANIFIKFCYLSYQILGAILAGLTLFSWAGILQNRLSR